MRRFELLLLRLIAEPGQTMAEYAILIGVIAVIVVVAAIAVGGSASSLFSNSSHHL